MTSHIAGRSTSLDRAAQALLAEADALARRIVAQLVHELPAYARLPREQLDGDVLTITADGVRTFARLLRSRADRRLPADYLAALSSSAAQRAEEQIPMSDVMRAYFVGAQLSLEHLDMALGPDVHTQMVELIRRTFDYLQEVTAGVADGYARERRLTLGETLSARLQLGNALVEGAPDDAVAEAALLAGVEVAPAYTVVALRVSEDRPGPADAPARRTSESTNAEVIRARLVREVRSHLLGSLDHDVLWLPNYRDALILIPFDPAERRTGLRPRDFDRVSAGLTTPVSAGIATGASAASGVSVAARTAIEVRDLVERLRRKPGCYELADVALEYQMSRPGPGQRALADLVSPLTGERDLRATLQIFIDENRHRTRTARRLGVHPNTVDNRLRRIASLTGLDPTRPHDMTRLEAAMAAALLGS
ncbi:PucR family transcriptional regulator [Cryptosporangium minutisporangium]|uniref:Helix-turn-helix domain-containing protein n=1 Tax=Cryptosporangium minutisporangium TaxID=113569 RepID=A0ABP6SSJ0_9ACTN